MKDYLKIFENASAGSKQDSSRIEIALIYREFSRRELNALYDYCQSLAQTDRAQNRKENAQYFYLAGLLHELGDRTNFEVVLKALDTVFEPYPPFTYDMYKRIFINQHDEAYYASKAIWFYKKAIKFNHPGAMTRRAFMHENGKGGPRNIQAAITLLDQAVKLNYPQALNNRGRIYMEMGGQVNDEAAIALFDKGIKLNYSAAAYNRAALYLQGIGRLLNLNSAFSLFIKTYIDSAREQDKWIKEKAFERLKDLFPKVSHYYRFKAKFFIPNLFEMLVSSHSYDVVTTLLTEPFQPSAYHHFNAFFRPKEISDVALFRELANDREMPLPEQAQITYCKALLSRNPLIIHRAESEDECNLVGKTLAFFARDHFDKKQYQRADIFYSHVPKKASNRAEVCVYLAQRTYFELKQKGLSSEDAYKQAKPILDEALILKDKAAELFYYYIADEITKSSEPYLEQVISKAKP